MARVSLPLAAALIFTLNAVPVHGQRGSAKPQHATTSRSGSQATAKPPTSHGPTHTTASAKPTTHGSSAKPTTTTTHGSAAKGQSATHGSSAKLTTPGSAKKTAAATTAAGAGTAKTASKKDSKTTAAAGTSTSTTTTTSGGTTTTELTPVQQKLQKNTNLASKLQSRLPEGTDLMKAAEGFRNLGQFVAACNVSHNLGISFDKLKADMVTKHMSLGQAIHDLKPASSATIEAQHAEFEANQLIAQTPETPTTTTSSTTTTTTTTTSPAKTKTKKPTTSGR